MAYLVQRVCVQQDPTKLNNLGGVLGHVHAVLVAGSGDVDDDIAVDLEGGVLLGSHSCGRKGGRREGEREEEEREGWRRGS